MSIDLVPSKLAYPTNVLYVRQGAAESELKFYDPGYLQLFSAGAPSTFIAGELWVTYDIEFFKPH